MSTPISKAERPKRPKPRLPRGLRDRGPDEIAGEEAALATIRRVYESYGFAPLETPALEYTDALGKFLPDVDRPGEGVFSLKDDDDQWLSLRYDLTAPLARHVAAHFQHLAKPFRRYAVGRVWRNEKPGPGRFREFTQFDADTVGSSSPAADAELLMMVCDTLEALGLKRGDYIIKLNSRKLLDGVLEAIGLGRPQGLMTVMNRGVVLRAVDKLDRLGPQGVFALLTTGRKDESGDFTHGADLSQAEADNVMRFLGYSSNVQRGYELDVYQGVGSGPDRLGRLASRVVFGPAGHQGLEELSSIINIVRAAGYGEDRVDVDQSIVRGLDYYTGAVFEAQLTFPVTNDDGTQVVFGSVAGGGRYDDLVARFTGQSVPATGVSIGVSRLISALAARGQALAARAPLVVVTVMDKAETASAFAMAGELRRAGFRAEAYVGTGKLGDQFKYADRRGAAIAVVEGSDERARGEVTLKDLALGAELAKSMESRAQWVEGRAAQKSVARADLVGAVAAMLGR